MPLIIAINLLYPILQIFQCTGEKISQFQFACGFLGIVVLRSAITERLATYSTGKFGRMYSNVQILYLYLCTCVWATAVCWHGQHVGPTVADTL